MNSQTNMATAPSTPITVKVFEGGTLLGTYRTQSDGKGLLPRVDLKIDGREGRELKIMTSISATFEDTRNRVRNTRLEVEQTLRIGGKPAKRHLPF